MGKRRHHGTHVNWQTRRDLLEHRRKVGEARKEARRAKRAMYATERRAVIEHVVVARAPEGTISCSCGAALTARPTADWFRVFSRHLDAVAVRVAEKGETR